MARAATAITTERTRTAKDPASFNGKGVRGLTFERRWTRPGVHPYDEITWELRSAEIKNESGKTVFEQHDIEVPAFWSQLATNVVVSKYFRGHIGTPGRERSVKQLIDRVVNTITAWAQTQRYFRDGGGPGRLQGGADPPPRPPEDGLQQPGLVQRRRGGQAAVLGLLHQLRRGHDVLDHGPGQDGGHALQVRLGRRRQPEPHPRLARRRCRAAASPAGPVSFMKGFDAFAGVVKSGGKTRRAAKMVILDADHPDVMEFIDSKANEEKKAWALIEAGYDPSFTGEAYGSVFFQNANHSVRVTDEFMRDVETGARLDNPRGHDRRARGTRTRLVTSSARMADAAWICGDPGHPVRHDDQ